MIMKREEVQRRIVICNVLVNLQASRIKMKKVYRSPRCKGDESLTFYVIKMKIAFT